MHLPVSDCSPGSSGVLLFPVVRTSGSGVHFKFLHFRTNIVPTGSAQVGVYLGPHRPVVSGVPCLNWVRGS